MESMDLDSSDTFNYRSNSLPSPTGSPHSPTNVGDLSDMEIDSNSPPSQQSHRFSQGCGGSRKNVAVSSSLLDCVNNSMSNILSLKSKIIRNKSCKHDADVPVCGVNQSATSARNCYSAPIISSTLRKGNKNVNTAGDSCYQLQRPGTSLAVPMPVKTKKKSGYGLNDSNDDDLFCHYPRFKEDSISSPVRSRTGQARAKEREESHSATPIETVHVRSSHNEDDSDSNSKSKQSKMKKHCGNRILLNSMCLLFICVIISILLYYITMPKSCHNDRLFQNKSLEVDLKSDLFGQRLASEIINKQLNQYFSQYLPTGNINVYHSSQKDRRIDQTERRLQYQPLVLSFHGSTGVGKNFASGIVARSFDSANIHQLVIPLLFPHAGTQELFTSQIQDQILSNIKHCSVNLFIIDEMDKAFPAVTRGLLTAMQTVSSVCSLTPTPVIFILISNTHAVEINQVFVDHFTKKPSSTQNRLDIKEESFHSIFKSGWKEEKEWYSDLFTAGFIDAFVPFLPLEKTHVIDCVKRDLVSKRVSTDGQIVSKVLEELSFSVLGDLELSNTGCKRVADKVNYVIFNHMD